MSKLLFLYLLIFVIIINVYINKVNIVKFSKKLISVLPFYLVVVIINLFFYNSGRIIKFIGINLYVEGMFVGLQILIKGVIVSGFIFSLNLLERKYYILFSIKKYLNKLDFVNRIVKIVFLTFYFIEIFFKNLTESEEKIKIYNLTLLIKKSFNYLENSYKNIIKLINKNYENEFNIRIYDFCLLTMILLIFSLNIYAGGLFGKLF